MELKLPPKRGVSRLQVWLEYQTIFSAGTDCSIPSQTRGGLKLRCLKLQNCMPHHLPWRLSGRDHPTRLPPLPPHLRLCNHSSSAPGSVFGDHRLLERISEWAALASRAKLITQSALPLPPILLCTALITSLATIALPTARPDLLPLCITFSFIRSRVYHALK